MSQSDQSDLFDEIHALVTARAQGEATPEQSERLKQLLTQREAALALYVRYIQETVALRKMAAVDGISQVDGSTFAPQTNITVGSQKLGQSPSPSHLSRLAIAALAAFVAIGILAYDTFWSAPHDPVVKQTSANGPAARIANLTEAKWDSAFSPAANGVLTTGQRLILQSGSAEITFNRQARVILQGPAEFIVVDAGECRLSDGRLTAHVPNPAKGFKVHTPSGTVTDLGTEFGVYVVARADQQSSREEEQQPGGGQQIDGKQPPVTEVHVFKGKVEVAPGDQLVQAPTPVNPSESSTIRHPQSTILQAGEAVTIIANKVQPLPSADPFKFALDKLNGKPRQVLLAEDFESYDVGVKQNAIGAWILQGSTRKGQGVVIADLDKGLVDETARSGLPDPSLNPPPPSIGCVLRFVPSAPNPPDTFPRIAHPIDTPQLAGTCKVLVECNVFPTQDAIEPSFALGADTGDAPGIAFWRNADLAAPRPEWRPWRCYRIRVLMDVVDGKLREARVERSQWSGDKGWVRDADFKTPVPQVDWTTPPRFVIFGYPVVTPQTSAGAYHIDNIRLEVISDK
ncbi:MAG: FecR family protein [Planctomycetales bacterium]|nr:FecR family protein [Planctomycetales bacterium]